MNWKDIRNEYHRELVGAVLRTKAREIEESIHYKSFEHLKMGAPELQKRFDAINAALRELGLAEVIPTPRGF